MKILSTPEQFKLEMEGEILLSPKPARKDIYVGQYTAFARPPASIDIVHESRHQHVAYQHAATVIGPPQNLWQAAKLLYRVARWAMNTRKAANKKYNIRTAAKKI